MQILSSTSVTGVLAAFVFLFLVASISVTNHRPNQTIQSAIATNGTTNTIATSLSSTNGSNITLGNPQLSYTEYDKATSFKPAIVNGTQGIESSFTGYGVVNGMNITDNGTAFVTNSTGGAIHTVASGVLVSGIGSAAGKAGHIDRAIGHYGADGKLRDTGIILNTKATGNLAFLGNMVGIYKDEIEKTGIVITKVWFWK